MSFRNSFGMSFKIPFRISFRIIREISPKTRQSAVKECMLCADYTKVGFMRQVNFQKILSSSLHIPNSVI